ncbi:MAG: hypothetical protein K0Q91_38 [Fibrobacteria bacterium]|jgi:hypothetical protein|nr:hypothetical protein [Fibrobacteria bacterium]
MKKILPLVTLLAALAHPENRTKFSVDPMALFVANLQNFEMERTVFDGKLGWAFYFARTGTAAREIDGYAFYGTEQALTAKYYFNNVSRSSLWLGGALSVASANVYERVNGSNTLANSATNIGTLGVHARIGYQWKFGSWFVEPVSGLGFALTNNLFGGSRYQGDVEEAHLLLKYGIQSGLSF